MVSDNVFSSSSLDDDKDAPIRFSGGKYVGKTGWLRKSKRHCGVGKICVLVDLGNEMVKKT